MSLKHIRQNEIDCVTVNNSTPNEPQNKDCTRKLKHYPLIISNLPTDTTIEGMLLFMSE